MLIGHEETTNRSINTCLTEQKRYCRLLQTEQSAVAERVLQDNNLVIQFDRTDLLSTVTHFLADFGTYSSKLFLFDP